VVIRWSKEALTKSENAYAKLSKEKYKIIKVPRIVIGNPKENRFSCGADRVIMPIETLMSNTMIITGSIIIEAFKNIEPEASIPP